MLAGGGGTQKTEIILPCATQRSCNGNPAIRAQQVPFSPQTPDTKCFSSKRWLKFWFSFYAGWSLRSQVRCLDSHCMEGEREGPQSQGCSFSYLSVEYPSKLLSASLYWSKTMFLFVYLDTLGLPQVTESLQRFHSPPHSN